MTIVREEENGGNGDHAGGVWRGGRCPSSRDTRAGALARFGVIDPSDLGSIDLGVCQRCLDNELIDSNSFRGTKVKTGQVARRRAGTDGSLGSSGRRVVDWRRDDRVREPRALFLETSVAIVALRPDSLFKSK
jgi:hypothetical protein